MAVSVTLTLTPNPAAEYVSKYSIYEGATKLGEITNLVSPSYVIPNVAPGPHSYVASATNLLGEGPKSDPVTANVPAAVPSKTVIVNISISVS